MEKPYVPFYKPYGMTDEEYHSEVRKAEQRLAEWEAEQENEQLLSMLDNEREKEQMEAEAQYHNEMNERIESTYYYDEGGNCDGFSRPYHCY